MKLFHFIKGRFPAFKNAFSGLYFVVASQKNSWIHATATLLVIFLALLLQLPIRDWALLVLVIGLVWTTEIFNTTIEVLVDLVSPNYNHLAKIAKDTGAAAVLITAITSVIIGLLIFIPPIFKTLSNFQ
jgi:diacylglycerol kinase